MSDTNAELLTEGHASGEESSILTAGLSATGTSDLDPDEDTGGIPVDMLDEALASMIEAVPGGGFRFTADAMSRVTIALNGVGDVRFEVEMISERQRLAASTQNVRVRVLAFRGKVPLYAPAYTAYLAVTALDLADAEWEPAPWDEDGCVSLLIGPDGGVPSPSAGTVNYVYIKIVNAPETFIQRVSTVSFL